MKAPAFWYQPKGILSTLLKPFGWLYGIGGKLLRSKDGQRFPIPVISIGNIICGGAGKTPTALALAKLLQLRGHKVHFVTRGYGGSQVGPVEVDPMNHSPLDVGDEPLLLARQAPTWVAKERALGVQKAAEKGAQLIILDDGHQTTGLYKDVSFVVLDFSQGFGNGCVIPAGPLREDLSTGLKRTDALIGIGQGEISISRPLFKAKSIPQPLVLPSNRVIAFCGLGFPQKFYKMLEDLETDLVATHSFPDHYIYKKEDLLGLQKMAKIHEGVLVTTRKDAIKIPTAWQISFYVLDINIEFEDPEGMYHLILEKASALRGKR
ncbi:MAG: tetraacyldisaccharide 4'-kinase [Alphaproteobacteria bacterium]|nr:tetraacyldisaccharide 4'-kinase [Alphaproteobacteria bacterium]